MKREEKELLSASIDRELTPEEKAELERLLRESLEANQSLKEYQEDQERIRKLSRSHLPEDFSEQVMQQVRAMAQPADGRSRSITQSWRQMLIAATVILAMGIGTAFLLSQLVGPDHANDGANKADKLNKQKNQEKDNRPKEKVNPQPNSMMVQGRTTPVWFQSPWKSTRGQSLLRKLVAQHYRISQPLAEGIQQFQRLGEPQFLAWLIDSKYNPADNHEVPFQRPAVFTFPTNPDLGKSPFKVLDLNLPEFLTLHQGLEAELKKQLARAKLHYVDISVKQSWIAVPRFIAAGKQAGLNLIVDPVVYRRTKNKYPTMYMVYIENITREQAIQLFQELREIEQKSVRRKPSNKQYGSLMIQPLDENGSKQIARSLGITHEELLHGQGKSQPKGEDNPLKHTPKAGQGTRSSQPKLADGILLPYVAVRHAPSQAKEVLNYLRNRKGMDSEKLHIILLLRPQQG